MNIWIFNHHAREYGRHPSLAKYLTESGESIQLFSSSFLHNTYKESKRYYKDEFYTEEEIDNYKRIYIKTPRYYGNGIKRLFNQLVFSLRAYMVGKIKINCESTPEVIIGSSVHLFTGLTAYFLAKKSNAKFIFEIRDIWPQTLVDLGAFKKDSLLTKLMEQVEKFLYKRADLIVSVLPNGENHIEKYGISKTKVVYLPNGIDITEVKKSIKNCELTQELEEYFQTNKDKFILTYSGSHGIANGLDTIIKAAKLLESNEKIQFLLVGDGPEKNKLKDLVKRTSVSNVTFINTVKKEQVALILEKSDACLFHLNKTPVFNYGISSNKLFDYMLSGNPMIFAVETSYDFAEASQNGFSVVPESPTEMSKAIKKMFATSKKDLKEMGENGKQFVMEKHDYKVLSEKLSSEIRKI